jgi:hypothetical protein
MVILLSLSKLLLVRKHAIQAVGSTRSELCNIVTRTIPSSFNHPISSSALKMSPIPTIVIGKNPDIAKAVREELLPEYDGKFC